MDINKITKLSDDGVAVEDVRMIDEMNVKFIFNVFVCFSVALCYWMICTVLKGVRIPVRVVIRSPHLDECERREQERFRKRCEEWLIEKERLARIDHEILVGEAEEINMKYLMHIGVSVEKVFQVYQCVSEALNCFKKRLFKEFYVQLNNIMMQFTGRNTLEYLAFDKRFLTGIEGVVRFLLELIRSDVDKVSCKLVEEADLGDKLIIKGNANESNFKKTRNFLETVNKNSNDWVTLLNSDFSKRVTLLTSLLICIPALSAYGISPNFVGHENKMLQALKFKYENYSGVSFAAVMLEHTSWVAMKVCDMFSIIVEHGVVAGLRSLFVARGDFTAFDKEYAWLKVNSKNFKCRNLVVDADGKPDPFSLDTYRHRCLKALELAAKIELTLKHDVFALNRIRTQKYHLLDFLSECGAAQFINEKRPYPYAMMLTGPPEVGKSTIATALFDQMHLCDNKTKRFAIPYNASNIYTRNPNDDFYSGFDSSKVGMLIDDVAQKTPELVKQLGGDDLADLIQVINTVPFLTNQAELKDKGKTPMMIRYFIGTTNTPDLSVKHVFNCPSAVYRRMTFVSVAVKERYRKEGSVAIAEGIDSNNLDVWDFSIYRFKPTNDVDPMKEYWDGTRFIRTANPPVLNITKLMAFVRDDIDRHWTREEVNDERKHKLLNSNVCEHGMRQLVCDECANVGHADELLRVPKWIAEEVVTEVISEHRGLRNAFRHVYGLTLFIPIYMSIALGNAYLFLFGLPYHTQPILPLRLARYLITQMPEGVSLPWFLRVYRLMPSYLVNKSSLYSADCLKLYIANKYNAASVKVFTWEEYYSREVIREWAYSAVAVFLGTFVLVRGWKWFTEPNKVGEASDVKMPVADPDELKRDNHWIRQRGIGIFPAVGSTIRSSDLETKVIMNTVLLKFRCAERTVRTNGFVLQNNLIVTVFHCIDGGSWPDSVVVTYLQDSAENVTIESKVDQSCCVIDEHQDLFFIRIDKLNMRYKLTPYFPDDVEPIHIKCPGYHSYFGLDYERVALNPVSVATVTRVGRTYTYKSRSYNLDGCVEAHVRDPTFAGMCGSPLVLLQGTQKMIAGIHCAGPENKENRVSYVRVIQQKTIKDVVERLNVIRVDKGSQAIATIVGNADAMVIDRVHPKCPTHKYIGQELVVLGGCKLPRVSPRTRVANSPIVDDVLKEFQGQYDDVIHVSPIECNPKMAIDLSMSQVVINAQFYPDEINDVVEAMTKEFVSRFTPEMLKRLHPYPMGVAINGVDGIPYLERINLSTSGGYGHPGPKRKLFVAQDPVSDHAVNYGVGDDLKQEIDWILARYRDGCEANPVFKCSFKDEPITKEKAAMSKVRIFSGSPVAFSIVVRMYFMCLIREFVGHKRLQFEMAIGANAHGEDWQNIYEQVITHGVDRVFAGDYKHFDKQMPPELILAAFRVMRGIFVKAGWSTDSLQIVDCIAVDTAYPTLDLFGTLVKCFGSNPSGHVLTTIVNSLVNSLYIRLACRRILLVNRVKFDLSDFRNIVSLVTYGDDNCGSVNASYPMITHTTIQEALSEAGITYTTDDKKSLSVGLTHITDITFLKRRFVYNWDLRRVGGPLLEESLFKSLTVWTWSKVICEKEQLAAVIESANREYFFYGRDVFEKRHKFFKNILKKYDCVQYLDNELLTYEQILQELL